MNTLDGTPICVGMQVYLLQIPVMKAHEFKVGVVEKLDGKSVAVSYPKEDRWCSEPRNTIVHRYPQQLIAVKDK